MAKMFRLTIECDNAAFEDDATYEISRILGELAKRIAGSCEGDFFKYRNVTDVNGNVCGTFRLKDESDES